MFCFIFRSRLWFIQWRYFILCHIFVLDFIFCWINQRNIRRHDPLFWIALLVLTSNKCNTFIFLCHNNTNFIVILLFASSGHTDEDSSCCFECSFLTKPFCYHFVSLTDGSNQNFARGYPTYLFFFYARIRISTNVTHQKPTRCSLLSVKHLNHFNDTDQERFSVVRRAGYRTLW